MESATRELIEIEAIKRLKYKYMRCIDMKLWDEIATTFIPEATCSYSAGHYSYEGRDEIVAWLKKGMTGTAFIHRIASIIQKLP